MHCRILDSKARLFFFFLWSPVAELLLAAAGCCCCYCLPLRRQPDGPPTSKPAGSEAHDRPPSLASPTRGRQHTTVDGRRPCCHGAMRRDEMIMLDAGRWAARPISGRPRASREASFPLFKHRTARDLSMATSLLTPNRSRAWRRCVASGFEKSWGAMLMPTMMMQGAVVSHVWRLVGVGLRWRWGAARHWRQAWRRLHPSGTFGFYLHLAASWLPVCLPVCARTPALGPKSRSTI
ncbi:hypothetical protein BS50DRAFT_168775 [Corynespora cassiicola Philippines]|uniref:Uncharacterized protein n=1 Tax=Corynespora cassiicola Philippines TaxID=1448308 RepID=A0A2T2P5M6_CORCC|nr:hypothetical protein BS50DRAFT_168775 [Corynespora cassiicola Philippines]